jgi:hypothetical protein
LIYRFARTDPHGFFIQALNAMPLAAYHLIWTAYGWLLPNDPRGSSSHEIRVERLEDLGELHYGRKQIQPPSREIREVYERAGGLLKHPLLTFGEDDFPLIADGFRRVIHDERYTCYACAIMPDHVHVLIRKHKHDAEAMIDHLQARSKEILLAEHRRFESHPVWGGPGWRVFLYSVDAGFRKAI